MFARIQGIQNNLLRDARTADKLDNNINFWVINNFGVILSEYFFYPMLDSLLGITRTHTNQLKINAKVTLEILFVVSEDVKTATAYRACSN